MSLLINEYIIFLFLINQKQQQQHLEDIKPVILTGYTSNNSEKTKFFMIKYANSLICCENEYNI